MCESPLTKKKRTNNKNKKPRISQRRTASINKFKKTVRKKNGFWTVMI
jgi:hypothetical protein